MMNSYPPGPSNASTASLASSSSSTSSPWRMFKRKASQELKKSNSRSAVNDSFYPPTPPKSIESSSLRRSSTDSGSTQRSGNSWHRQLEDVRDGFEEHTLSKRQAPPIPISPMNSTPSLATASTTSKSSSYSLSRNRSSTPIHPSHFQATSMRPSSFIPPWFEFKYNNKESPYKDYTGPKSTRSRTSVVSNDLNPAIVYPQKLESAHDEIYRLNQQLATAQQELTRCKGQLSKANDEHCRIVDQVKREVRDEVEQACREEYEEKIKQLSRQLESSQKHLDNYQALQDDYTSLTLENNHLRQAAKHMSDNDGMLSPRSDSMSLNPRGASPIRSPTVPSLESVREQFQALQASITSLMEHLLTHADRKKATALFTQAYPTLNLAPHLTGPAGSLSDFVILMLTEKLVMDTLMRDVFCVPLQPGVPIQSEYSTVKAWMEPLQREWALQFRQHICTLVWEEPKVQREVEVRVRAITFALLEVLQLGFPSFTFFEHIQEIVNQAVKLSLAMQAQEELVYPIHVQEGSDLFDPKRMLSIVKGENGLDSKEILGTGLGGVVMFCICPPFIGGRKDDLFAKGKVYCE